MGPTPTLVFWITKNLATTLGETGVDALSMSSGLGYLVSTGVFAVVFAVLVGAQVKVDRFNPILFWSTIIATTTLGTTLADYVDRSLRIGYTGVSLLLVGRLVASLLIWKRDLETFAVDSVKAAKAEFYYWMTIMFSQTLGTALGGWTADTASIGYLGSAAIFSVLLLIVYVVHRLNLVSSSIVF
ncbi:MAG: hypothetical protein WCQ20_09080 [Synechococcaceae cyanobacterium ELA739]